jgi:glycosyltransferase involved in cell wall biosynthesis
VSLSPRPTVTVIIPVFNDTARLRTCLEAIRRQDYPDDLVDVVVADNASTEDPRPALPADDPRFTVVTERRPGSYVARNTAVRHARGEVLAFTDADCVPHPGWLSAAVEALTAPDAPDAVGGDIVLRFSTGTEPVTGPELYEVVEGFDQESFVRNNHFAATANLVVPAAVFAEVGDFNPALRSGGDLEWGQRLAAADRRMGFSAAAAVDHPSRPSWGELTKKTVRIANGHVDLATDPRTAGFADHSWHDPKQTFTIWVRVWGHDWPAGRGAKARFAAARSWAGILELAVRLRRGELLGRRGHRA